MVLPTRLVLLRPAVVVHREKNRAGRLGRRAEIDSRLAAPGADLDERRRLGGRDIGLAGTKCGFEQRLPFVVGHEASGLSCRLEAGCRGGRKRGPRQRSAGAVLTKDRWRSTKDRPVRPRSRAAKATLTPSRSIDCATRRGPEARGWSPGSQSADWANSASPHSAGSDSRMRTGAFFGNRSRIGVPPFCDAGPDRLAPDGVGQQRAEDGEPVLAPHLGHGQVEGAQAELDVGEGRSAPSERISSWGVSPDR